MTDKLTKIYLAIPYTGMMESSFRQVNEATVKLLNLGYNVFSPITHSHPLTKYDIPGTWEFWQKIDFQFLDWVDELWILIPEEGVETVENSVGVQAEINYFKMNKPNASIVYVTNAVLDDLLTKSYAERGRESITV